MKKYIYLDREEAKKGMTLVVAVLDESNEEYKKEYVEVYSEDIPHYITYLPEIDSIREATEEEKVARNQIELADNQVIINNIICTYDKKYQKLVNGRLQDKTLKELVKEGTLTLEEIKFRKREELKRVRTEKIEENIEVKGDLYQVRKGDLDNFYNLKIAMDLDSKMKTQKVKWILADNTIKEFVYIELMGVLSAYMLRKQNLFLKFGELALQLESAKTVEEIETINWK